MQISDTNGPMIIHRLVNIINNCEGHYITIERHNQTAIIISKFTPTYLL